MTSRKERPAPQTDPSHEGISASFVPVIVPVTGINKKRFSQTIAWQQVAKSVWYRSGEDRIVPRHFSQVVYYSPVATQVLGGALVACLRLLLIVSIYFALIGTRISAFSAHSNPDAQTFSLWQARSWGQNVVARRRRSRAATDINSDIAASYSRYSSTNQREESIADQRRICRDAAAKNSHNISAQFEYADEAVSGAKRNRAGLNAMLQAAAAGEFQTLYIHSLSRLARESTISMPLLKRLVHKLNVRVVCVSEGIDSKQTSWDMIASVMSIVHERYITDLAHNVHRGQEGNVLAGKSVGDSRYGYHTRPVEGTNANPREKNARPLKEYVVTEEEAAWVKRIFSWFVDEGRSLTWIVKELNNQKAPKGRRAQSPVWHHNVVVGILSSEKYIGIWRWGVLQNKRDPETGCIYQEMRPEEETEKWVRSLPHLRIIDDDTFAEAQARLADNRRRMQHLRQEDGTLCGSQPGAARKMHSNLLSSLIRCGDCGNFFSLYGQYLKCLHHSKGMCGCQTQLKRALGARMILEAIRQEIFQNPTWLARIHEEAVKAWRAAMVQTPDELAAAKKELAACQQKIVRLVDAIEAGTALPDIQNRLLERRRDAVALEKRIAALEKTTVVCGAEPTLEWIRSELDRLDQLLQSDAPSANLALRRLIPAGVTVTEVRIEGRKRHYLRGRFTIDAVALGRACGFGERESDIQPACSERREFVIDFREQNPLDQPALEIKALYDQGLLETEIARRMQYSRAQVSKLLKHAHAMLNEPQIDGRKRRWRTPHPVATPPLRKTIQDEAMRLFEEGKLIADIAGHFNCDRATVHEALLAAHAEQGKIMPDGRSRRKTLAFKSRPRRQRR